MTLYNPLKMGKTVTYMLQNVEYQPRAYIAWLRRTRSFGKVMYRRQLEPTKAAKLFTLFVTAGMTLQLLAAVLVEFVAISRGSVVLAVVAVALIATTPAIWALAVCIPLVAGRILVSGPKEKRLIEASKTIFKNHKATKIAVAGSYGKTSMKELLGVVLGEGKNVAITPSNKNVASSHAIFARKLTGDEDVLVVEFGEGAPGDVARYTATLHPDIGVITGIAPAHLDHYASLDEAAHDIFSLGDYLHTKPLYVNGESHPAGPYIKTGQLVYTAQGVGDLKVTNFALSLEGMTFELHGPRTKYKLQTSLIGQHLVGPLTAAVSIAENIGLTKDQIEAGVAKTTPFEHRMQPRRLASGAWIIDDTYNGTIEGIRAGLALLKDLPARRKIYVTPGLVDQGAEASKIHNELGSLIAAAQPQLVVLMQNSAAADIQQGMQKASFAGELHVEADPLAFYTNIEHFVAGGDLVMMQNDWPDNYK